MKRLVLCRNDYPWKLVPKTVTEKEAEEVAKRLTNKHATDIPGPMIYYHIKTVEVPTESEFKNL